MCIQVAQSAWRETEELQLEALHPDPGRSPHRATPHYRGKAPTSGCLTVHLARKRVQPRNRMQENCTSGTVRGVPGNRHSYRRDCGISRNGITDPCIKILSRGGSVIDS